ncbi:phage protease [Wohlfahrtiimonas larvae]|uniref:Phage protease n=1 Tax=Wohlfahrtiimonas larvae TaxID=1157986 RepID=A0ABP9MXV9_9GAMM|nr:phage protease [Wohlfahrtiimonas larvae]
MKRSIAVAGLGLVALTTVLASQDTGGRIQIFPAGKFYAKDGRNPNGWELTKEAADKIIAAAQARKDDYLIDYEHQSLHAATNGQKVIAAGWFKNMEFIEGEGLFATPVDWTQTASDHIHQKEYRYISPTFRTNAAGEVVELFSVALTNTPAIDGMMGVVALSEIPPEPSSDVTIAVPAVPITKETFMSEVKKVLGIADEIAPDALIGAIRSLVNKVEYLTVQTPGNPNPAEYVPIAMFEEMRTEVATLKADNLNKQVTAIVETALTDGKLTPAQKAWALTYGAKDLVGLSDYLANATPIVMLNQQQHVHTGATVITEDVEAMTERARQMGISLEDYQARLAKMNQELINQSRKRLCQ